MLCCRAILSVSQDDNVKKLPTVGRQRCQEMIKRHKECNGSNSHLLYLQEEYLA